MAASAQKTPNIVLFVTDDHAQWALPCYGRSELHTPTFDYLASTGVVMEQAFTPSPVCSPARASLWTGTMPSRHGIHDYLDEEDEEVCAQPWLEGIPTLGGLLSSAGYSCAMSGKWHIGAPEKRHGGFDYWYAQSMSVSVPLGFEAGAQYEGLRLTSHYDSRAIVDHAIDFLHHRDRDRPFFLYVGLFDTHSPWRGNRERLVSHYRKCSFDDVSVGSTYEHGRLSSESLLDSRTDRHESLAQYYAAVSHIDEEVGRVLDLLEADGLLENTIVIYTSDHGLSLGQQGIWGKGNATRPYNMLDASIRVPLLLHSGSRSVIGGQRRDELVNHCDLFATVLDLASVEQPGNEGYPGQSFRRLLHGEPTPGDTTTLEAVYGEYGATRMVRTRGHKLLMRRGVVAELYDLERDPDERDNLAGDPSLSAKQAELAAHLARFFEQHEDPSQSGLRVEELPRHNREEEWRPHEQHRGLTTLGWLDRAELAARKRRGLFGTPKDRSSTPEPGP